MMALTLLALIFSATPAEISKPDSVAILPPSGKGPLEPGSWGLGFRVLGFAPEFRVRRAMSDRMAIGVDASWSGSYDRDETDQTRSSWNSSNSIYTRSDYVTTQTIEQSNSSLRIAIPFEWIFQCRGSLCFVGDAGPTYRLYAWERLTIQPGGSGSNIVGSQSSSSSTTHELGGTGSIGVRWEFIPGLALASSFGADAWYTLGEGEDESSREGIYPTSSESRNSSSGFGTRSWFGGIGLDAWF